MLHSVYCRTGFRNGSWGSRFFLGLWAPSHFLCFLWVLLFSSLSVLMGINGSIQLMANDPSAVWRAHTLGSPLSCTILCPGSSSSLGLPRPSSMSDQGAAGFLLFPFADPGPGTSHSGTTACAAWCQGSENLFYVHMRSGFSLVQTRGKFSPVSQVAEQVPSVLSGIFSLMESSFAFWENSNLCLRHWFFFFFSTSPALTVGLFLLVSASSSILHFCSTAFSLYPVITFGVFSLSQRCNLVHLPKPGFSPKYFWSYGSFPVMFIHCLLDISLLQCFLWALSSVQTWSLSADDRMGSSMGGDSLTTTAWLARSFWEAPGEDGTLLSSFSTSAQH
jgi:hypothetical protein